MDSGRRGRRLSGRYRSCKLTRPEMVSGRDITWFSETSRNLRLRREPISWRMRGRDRKREREGGRERGGRKNIWQRRKVHNR